MTERDYAYSASFDLYHPTGLRLRFSVAADEATDHRGRLGGYINSLMHDGYSATVPGLEPGEEKETVDGWVLGETSKEEACVYLYSVNAGLQYRIATVYVERIPELPFKVHGAKSWPGAAPTREMATAKKFLQMVPAFDIVMKPSGKMTDAGRPITRFDRIDGLPAPAPASVARTQRNDVEELLRDVDEVEAKHHGYNADAEWEEWQGAVDAYLWAVSVGACANEFEARASMTKVINSDESWGGRLHRGNKEAVYAAFFARQMEKLNVEPGADAEEDAPF